MNFKIEIWNYDEFSYDEATEYLNQMAVKGYALVRVNNSYGKVAYYEKQKGAKNIRYEAFAISGNSDSFGELP